MHNILIVEDDEVLNNGIQYCLNDEKLHTHGVYSFQQAEASINKSNYDLVILDVNLPDGNGFLLCETIRKIVPDIPIVFLTARDLEKDVIKGFDLGVDDYISKPFNIKILKKKIIAILKRYKKIQDDFYEAKYLKVDLNKREVYKNNSTVNLTPTEYRILELFIQEKNKVITKEVFIDFLYNQDGAFIDEHALSVYISRMRGKIEEQDNQFIKTIYGMGYMWIEE